jgi:hypothetical protein
MWHKSTKQGLASRSHNVNAAVEDAFFTALRFGRTLAVNLNFA